MALMSAWAGTGDEIGCKVETRIWQGLARWAAGEPDPEHEEPEAKTKSGLLDRLKGD